MKTTAKTARTIKDYTTTFYGGSRYGTEITVPAGSTVSNVSAMGADDNYRVWENYTATIKAQLPEMFAALRHDLHYHGLNIPAEYCEPYAN